jgi:hypothetical protein
LFNEIKSDPNISSKIRKTDLKNLFYYLPRTRFELFEPSCDNDHDLNEKYKKIYNDNDEETFIDELIFVRISSACKYNFIII